MSISRPLLAVDERLLPSLRNERKVASLEQSHGPTLQDLWPQVSSFFFLKNT